MLKFSIFLILFISGFSQAVTCSSGCNRTVTNSLTQSLTSAQNTPGAEAVSSAINVTSGANLIWASGGAQTWAYYRGETIPSAGANPSTWVYRKIDDYISVATRMVNACRTAYVPYNLRVVNENCTNASYTAGQTQQISDRQYQSQIRIDKKIVSGTYSANVLFAIVGFCQPVSCSSESVIVANIYLSLSITVPQTCTLNAGQIIDIDFGDISSGAFTTAGARPEGVNDIVRNVTVNCDNIAANTAMTLRLQADNVSGNTIVTNTNNDVGFVVADSSGTALIPNDLSSVIPFALDGESNSSVTIRVYPVSVTGNKPTEGPVTSQAYLRVDFA